MYTIYVEESILDFFTAHLATIDRAISSIHIALIVVGAGGVILSVVVFVYNRLVVNRKIKDFLEDKNTLKSMDKAANGYLSSEHGRAVLQEIIATIVKEGQNRGKKKRYD